MSMHMHSLMLIKQCHQCSCTLQIITMQLSNHGTMDNSPVPMYSPHALSTYNNKNILAVLQELNQQLDIIKMFVWQCYI